MAKTRYYTGIWLEEMRKTTKCLNHDRQCPSADSNQSPLEFKSLALLLSQLTQWRCLCCSVALVIVIISIISIGKAIRVTGREGP
jgi:hypothetical protein